MESNPSTLEISITIPSLFASSIADQLMDWCDSIISCDIKTVQIKRDKIAENHYMVTNGTKFTVKFNTAHTKYQDEWSYTDGVIRGCAFYSSLTKE